MKVILKRNKLADVILSPQKGSTDDSRLCRYVQQVPFREGMLLYHLLTGEMVLVQDGDADAAELYQKYFLVPQAHDDEKLYRQFTRLYTMLTVQRTKTVNHFTILTTTDCNARCFYCYELGSKREHMTAETAQQVVEYIKANANIEAPVHLSWFGGEPLYNLSVIDQITTSLQQQQIAYTSGMISNGYLFDEEMIRKADALWHLKKIQITLDGTEEIYNKRKAYIYRDGGSAYQRVLRNIAGLADAGIAVSIRLNLDQQNHADLLALVEQLHTELGQRDKIRIYCHELFQCSEEAEITSLKQSIDQKIKECGFYKKEYAPLGIKTNYCMADSAASILIMPDGSLHACEHFTEHTSFGSVFHNDNKKKALPYYQERLVEEQCKDCPALPVCIKLKCCPSTKSGCKEETAEKKLAAIRESMQHYAQEREKRDE